MTGYRCLGIVAVGAMLAWCSSAQATLIAYDGFDYTASQSVAGLAGGTGWSGAWGSVAGGAISVTSPGSTYSGLNTTGNGVTVTPASGLTSSSRSFATINSGTVYFSVLVDNTNGGTRVLGMRLFNNSTEVASIGMPNGVGTWSMWLFGNTVRSSTISTVSDVPTLLVLRVDFNVTGYNERIRLYVNPTPGAAEPVTASAEYTGDAIAAINKIDLIAGYSNGVQTTTVGTFDEVRIGTAWGDVTPQAVPEAASAAVLGAFAGATLLARRPICSK